ncbi:hypothetical protein BDK51DRAFT_50080 [Blyttiomyces helicus]|uniref:Uncharacterized protein n=1 Tax=Blyttiomyces helicus TaxID=388810 RepID=A0A4P9W1K4_9FUNG|nr:hypothetical protein BDK51DRAFT_50080 [Blyttiomyces helicus]|eukprot:RKO85984.1 hypothetical protein BDK51DRAFT_50080 [Blyttiomyces helicus]
MPRIDSALTGPIGARDHERAGCGTPPKEMEANRGRFNDSTNLKIFCTACIAEAQLTYHDLATHRYFPPGSEHDGIFPAFRDQFIGTAEDRETDEYAQYLFGWDGTCQLPAPVPNGTRIEVISGGGGGASSSSPGPRLDGSTLPTRFHAGLSAVHIPRSLTSDRLNGQNWSGKGKPGRRCWRITSPGQKPSCSAPSPSPSRPPRSLFLPLLVKERTISLRDAGRSLPRSPALSLSPPVPTPVSISDTPKMIVAEEQGRQGNERDSCRQAESVRWRIDRGAVPLPYSMLKSAATSKRLIVRSSGRWAPVSAESDRLSSHVHHGPTIPFSSIPADVS